MEAPSFIFFLKGWTMGGAVVLFLGGVKDRDSVLHFMDEEMDDGASALHIFDEGVEDGGCTILHPLD